MKKIILYCVIIAGILGCSVLGIVIKNQNNQKKNLELKNQELISVIDTSIEELSQLQNKYNLLYNANADLIEQQKNLQLQYDMSIVSLQLTQKQYQDLQKSANDTIKKLEAQIIEYQLEIETLEEDAVDYQSRLQTLESQIADNEEEISRLETEKAEMTIQIERLQNNITALTNEKNALQVDNNDLLTQVNNYETEIETLNSRIEILVSELNAENELFKKVVEGNVTHITADMLKDVTTLKDYLFYGCENLESVVIPENITELGEDVFYKCKNLHSVEIHSNLTSIPLGTFSGCEKLESVIIPETVTSIGTYAFNNTYALKSITIPKNVETISRAFGGAGLEEINIDSPVIYTKFLTEDFYGFNATNFKAIRILKDIVDNENNTNTFLNDESKFARTEIENYYVYTRLIQLPTPAPLSFDVTSGNVYITPVDNASGYLVNIKDSSGNQIHTKNLELSETSFNINSLNLPDNTVIEVYAVGDGLTYATSSGTTFVLQYTVLSSPTMTITDNILKFNNVDSTLKSCLISFSGEESQIHLDYAVQDFQVCSEFDLSSAEFLEIFNILNLNETVRVRAWNFYAVNPYIQYSPASLEVQYITNTFRTAPETEPIKLSTPTLTFDEELQCFKIDNFSQQLIDVFTFALFEIETDGVWNEVGGISVLNEYVGPMINFSGNFRCRLYTTQAGYLSSDYSNVIYAVIDKYIPFEICTLSFDENTQVLSWDKEYESATVSINIKYAGTGRYYEKHFDNCTSINVADLELESGYTYEICMIYREYTHVPDAKYYAPNSYNFSNIITVTVV